MRRRRVLASLALVGVAGCTNSTDGSESHAGRSTPDASPTDSESTVRARATTAGLVTVPEPGCPDDPAVPYTSAEDAPPLPEPPDEFTPEAVGEYVETYERTWQWREWADYGEAVSEVGVSVTLSVERVGEGQFLVGSSEAFAYGRVDHSGDGTYGAFDGPPYYFSYLVTRRAVRRAGGRRESDAANPVEDVDGRGRVLGPEAPEDDRRPERASPFRSAGRLTPFVFRALPHFVRQDARTATAQHRNRRPHASPTDCGARRSLTPALLIPRTTPSLA